MTDHLSLTDQAWQDAEALVERTERAARAGQPDDSFYEDLLCGLRAVCSARATALHVTDRGQRVLLGRSGVALHVETGHAEERADADAISIETAPLDNPSRAAVASNDWDSGRLRVEHHVNHDVDLTLEIHFERPVAIGTRESLVDLAEVLLGLAANFFVRVQFDDLRRRLDQRTSRDQLIGQLNQGVGIDESFTSIAAAVAGETSVDRVSLLRMRSGQARVLSTSAQSRIDRRSRQIRSLEKLVAEAVANGDSFSFRVGDPDGDDSRWGAALEPYVHQSGCREIHVEPICSESSQEVIAAVVLERFRVPDKEQRPIGALLDPIRQVVIEATRQAALRDDGGWGLLISRIANASHRRAVTTAMILLVMTIGALCFVPATLKLPVEGRVVAVERHRVFAPLEGTVAEVLVDHDTSVHAGQTLLTLRSPALELEQAEIEGALATARTQLASRLAMRSSSGGLSTRDRNPASSTEEQVLKTQIEGLQQRLALVQQQQQRLVITSPIDGRIDRWDLREAFTGRPVTYGQHLVDVIAPEAGWKVELDLPDQNAGYVNASCRRAPCRCTLRLRSDPTVTHQGVIESIASAAQQNPRGESIIRVVVKLDSKNADLRSGATVIARIHCEDHSLGFVGFRGLVEWAREQAWFP